MSLSSLTADLRKEFGKILEAQVQVFGPPPVRGVGFAGGFKIMIEDRGGDLGPVAMQKEVDKLIRAGMPMALEEADRAVVASRS